MLSKSLFIFYLKKIQLRNNKNTDAILTTLISEAVTSYLKQPLHIRSSHYK